MKLASFNDGTLDGKLIVVSKDLKFFTDASHISPTMQFALDNWSNVNFKLQNLYEKLNKNLIEKNLFNQEKVYSPLPRSYQWADCSAYTNHLKLARKARGADLPNSYLNNPLIYQGGSDDFLPPRSPITILDENWGVDLEAEIAVITNYIPMGSTIDKIKDKILFVMIANDISLRNLVPEEIDKGFGFYQSKPSTSFSPVAISLDELADTWNNGKLHKQISVNVNDIPLGRNLTGKDMTFNFYELIAHACKTRNLISGSIIGSGTISNVSKNKEPELQVSEGGRGYCCLVEKRMVEILKFGKPITPYLKNGDIITIEIFNDENQSDFGRIQQKIVKL